MTRKLLVSLAGVGLLGAASFGQADESIPPSATNGAEPSWNSSLDSLHLDLRDDNSRDSGLSLAWCLGPLNMSGRPSDQSGASFTAPPIQRNDLLPAEPTAVFQLIPLGPDEPPICFDGPMAALVFVEIPNPNSAYEVRTRESVLAPVDWTNLAPPDDLGLYATPKPPKPLRFEK